MKTDDLACPSVSVFTGFTGDSKINQITLNVKRHI